MFLQRRLLLLLLKRNVMSKLDGMKTITQLTIKSYKSSLLFVRTIAFILHGLSFQKLQKPLTVGKI